MALASAGWYAQVMKLAGQDQHRFLLRISYRDSLALARHLCISLSCDRPVQRTTKIVSRRTFNPNWT